jgi:hypothetical protein
MSKSVFTTDAAAELRGRVLFAKKVLGKGKQAKNTAASWGAVDKVNIFDYEVVANTNAKWTGTIDVETKSGQIRSKLEFKSLEGEDVVLPANKAQEAIAKGKKAIDLPLISTSARMEAVKATVAVSASLNAPLSHSRVNSVIQNVTNWKEVDKLTSMLKRKKSTPTDNPVENSIEWMMEEEVRENPEDKEAIEEGADLLHNQVCRFRLAYQSYMKTSMLTGSVDQSKVMREHGVLKWTQNFLSRKDFSEEEVQDKGEEPKYNRISKILHPNNPEKRLFVTIEEVKEGILLSKVHEELKPLFKEENNELLYGSTDKEFVKKAERLIGLPLGVGVTTLTKGKKPYETRTKFYAGCIQRSLGIIESLRHEETCDEFGPTRDWFLPLLTKEGGVALKKHLDELVKETPKGKIPDKQAISAAIWAKISPKKAEFIHRLSGTKGFKGPILDEEGNVSLTEKLCSQMNASMIDTKGVEFGDNKFLLQTPVANGVLIDWSNMAKDTGEGKNTFGLVKKLIKTRCVEHAHDPREFSNIGKSIDVITESIEQAYNRQKEMAQVKGRQIPDEMIKEKMWAEVFKLRSRAEVQWFALCLHHRQVAFKKSVLKTDYKFVDDDEEIDWDNVN